MTHGVVMMILTTRCSATAEIARDADDVDYKINQSINHVHVQSAPYVTKTESDVPIDHCQWRDV